MSQDEDDFIDRHSFLGGLLVVAAIVVVMMLIWVAAP